MADRRPALLAEHLEECWPEVAKFFAERNWPDTKLGNAAATINEDVPAILRALLRDEWVPVSAGLPGDDITVMIAVRDNDEPVWVGWHISEGGWWSTLGPMGDKVTHWKPIPEGPNG